MKFKVRIEAERCKGCGLCIHACPRQVLRLGEDLNAKGYHYAVPAGGDDCIGCLRCVDMCPDVAIEIDRVLTSLRSVR